MVDEQNDITKKRKFNYKVPEIWEMENKLYQDYKEDTKNIFFANFDEGDSDTEEFYDFIYKGKSVQV